MKRVFLPPEAFGQGGIITIEGSACRYLIRVLRLQVGDSLVAADGSGREYLARLAVVKGRVALAEVVEEHRGAKEPCARVTLILGLPKGAKLSLVTQKATELGVAGIIPVTTSRSVVHMEVGKEEGRCSRWQAIAEAAATQSGRSYIPPVTGVKGLEEALQTLPEGTRLIMPWEEEREQDLKEVLAGIRSAGVSPGVAVLIGPEGGWTREEVELARSYGAVTVSLGPRILRCETAAIVALSIVLYELGDLGVS